MRWSLFSSPMAFSAATDLEFYDAHWNGTLVAFSTDEEREEVLSIFLSTPLPSSIFSSSILGGSMYINYKKFLWTVSWLKSHPNGFNGGPPTLILSCIWILLLGGRICIMIWRNTPCSLSLLIMRAKESIWMTPICIVTPLRSTLWDTQGACSARTLQEVSKLSYLTDQLTRTFKFTWEEREK